MKDIQHYDLGISSTDYLLSWFRERGVNSLAPRRCSNYLKLVIFELKWRIDILTISCLIALKLMPQDLTNDQSTLVQVMAWSHQAISYYLSQCWPTGRSMRNMLTIGHNELIHFGLMTTLHEILVTINWGNYLTPTGSSGTCFNQILIKFQTFSFKEVHLKMTSERW